MVRTPDIYRPIGICVALVLILAFHPSQAAARTTIDKKKREITINVLFCGPMAQKWRVDRWVKRVETWYNGQDSLIDRGVTVKVNATRQDPIVDANTCPPNVHCVLVERPPRGTVFVSGCSGVSGGPQQTWNQQGHTASWVCALDCLDTDRTVVHEFGHLLGLPDRYTYDANTGKVTRDPNRPDDIMNVPSLRSRLMPDDVNAILKKVGATDEFAVFEAPGLGIIVGSVHTLSSEKRCTYIRGGTCQGENSEARIGALTEIKALGRHPTLEAAIEACKKDVISTRVLPLGAGRAGKFKFDGKEHQLGGPGNLESGRPQCMP